jgi:SAM-dependent methyltransferase
MKQRLDHLEARMLESAEETWERSRTRWRNALPDRDLTWHVDLPGGPFVENVAKHGAFGPAARILEIGPGYGRLLEEILKQGHQFERYEGLDLSEFNVQYLREHFALPNVSFTCGDVESAMLGESFNVMLSSLTFKHLFPTFERGLANVAAHMDPGGLMFFDLREGIKKGFELDDVTFIRSYTRADVETILTTLALELVGFEQVEHGLGRLRLLVIARKPT